MRLEDRRKLDFTFLPVLLCFAGYVPSCTLRSFNNVSLFPLTNPNYVGFFFPPITYTTQNLITYSTQTCHWSSGHCVATCVVLHPIPWSHIHSAWLHGPNLLTTCTSQLRLPPLETF